MSAADLLPVLSLGGHALYHAGTLDAAQRGCRGESYEGHGLSVSLAPHAWREIARLGGEPLWALRPHTEGNECRLLDMHAARREGVLLDAIEWAQSQGLCAYRTLWRAWRFDSEIDEWTHVLCSSEAEAIDEVTLFGDVETPEGPDGAPGVSPCETLVGLEPMSQLIGRTRLHEEDVTDYAAMLWLDRHAPEIDGVWWSERYAPEALSAPRGALLPSRLDRFASHQVDWDAIEDDPESEALHADNGIDPVARALADLADLHHQLRRASWQSTETAQRRHASFLTQRVDRFCQQMLPACDAEALSDPERERISRGMKPIRAALTGWNSAAIHVGLTPLRLVARDLEAFTRSRYETTDEAPSPPTAGFAPGCS